MTPTTPENLLSRAILTSMTLFGLFLLVLALAGIWWAMGVYGGCLFFWGIIGLGKHAQAQQKSNAAMAALRSTAESPGGKFPGKH